MRGKEKATRREKKSPIPAPVKKGLTEEDEFLSAEQGSCNEFLMMQRNDIKSAEDRARTDNLSLTKRLLYH